MMNSCTCGSGIAFSRCCEPFLSEKMPAASPEKLMRSRYSAFALGGYGDYLLKTWFAPMAKGLTAAELSEKSLQWLSLEVLGSGVDNNQGWVEFKAIYLDKDGRHVLHEKSVFTCIDNCWLYIGGEIAAAK